VTKRQAEQYRKLEAATKRASELEERFKALGIEVPRKVAMLDLPFEVAEQILERLEAKAPRVEEGGSVSAAHLID
jgi:hypothetical protein